MSRSAALSIGDLEAPDLERVVEIETRLTGDPKSTYWADVFRDFVRDRGARPRLALAARADGQLIGYLVGEVRAFEFGSEPCGWILVVGVDPAHARSRVATGLLELARRRFRDWGVDRVRTMVGRTDVPLLSFFRANGFAGGTFVQLELSLTGDA